MDLKSLQDAASNLTLYDLKASVRKVQNAVMNYTEMESKVREATNNEPWGASSTMMQEIANATFNYQQLNEIMPMIYKRFTEKSAEEWRQIYKALQLMEFLIKNGSERVIDDARSHLSLLKMLRQFHYIDQNGKDQGINVRNRSKELTELLSDVDRIRQERKKARQTKNKYGGVEGGAGSGLGVGSSGGRYGGFGSESAGYGGGSSTFGGSSRQVYGDGGGFGGEASTDDYDEGPGRGGADKFDEYDEYDDGGAQARPGRRKGDVAAKRAAPKKAAPAPKPKEPEVDLFDFGDEPATTFTAPASSSAVLSAPPSQPVAAADDDDDFDDFQSATPAASAAPAAPAKAVPAIPAPNYSSFSTAAPTSSTQYAQPTPQSSGQNAAFSNIFSTKSPPPSSTGTQLGSIASPKPSGYQPSGPNYFQSVQVANQSTGGSFSSQVKSPGAGQIRAKPVAKSGGGDAFASLLGGSGMKNKGPAQKGPTIADMAKQKSQAGLYGANAPAAASAPAQQKPNTGSSGLNDLLG
ncbi:putative ENTH domain-containing protein [Septoria linicola]|nr:putative ENTH domain-containing protein [Septoria linicola]